MYWHDKNRDFGNEQSFVGRAVSGVRKASAAIVFGAAVFGLCMAVPAHAADKLIVKDATGTTTKFVVTDSGFVGAGMDNPLYNYDLSGQGVSKSSMHFSLNGNDVGGWITSVADNNFFISSGAMWNASSGGWIQKSSDGNSVFVGSGVVGFRLFTQGGGTVGQPVNAVERVRIDYNGNVGIGTTTPTHLLQLKGGAYSDGATWVNASSRALKENIKDLSAGDAMAAFTKLEPVTFNYKADKTQGHVGFIAEDVPALVAMKDRKGLSALDIVGVLTKVVQEQQKTITELTAKVNKLQQEMDAKGVVALGIK